MKESQSKEELPEMKYRRGENHLWTPPGAGGKKTKQNKTQFNSFSNQSIWVAQKDWAAQEILCYGSGRQTLLKERFPFWTLGTVDQLEKELTSECA